MNADLMGTPDVNLVNKMNLYESFMSGPNKPLTTVSQMSRLSQSGIKILTYNVSWQSTSGLQPNWPICNSVDDANNERHYTKCIQNIATVIDENAPYDFVCLQEVANLDKIIAASLALSNMKYLEYQSGPEKMATFWNGNQYNLVENINGSFRTGRPFQILIFRENICLINLHLPHLNKTAVVKNLEYLITKIDPKITNYRFIMAGDFNYALNNPDEKKNFLPSLQLYDLKFHINPKYIATCCIPPFRRNTLQFDHVIDTLDMPVSVASPKVAEMASDHLPIIAILNDISVSRIYKNKYKSYRKKYGAFQGRTGKMI